MNLSNPQQNYSSFFPEWTIDSSVCSQAINYITHNTLAEYVYILQNVHLINVRSRYTILLTLLFPSKDNREILYLFDIYLICLFEQNFTFIQFREWWWGEKNYINVRSIFLFCYTFLWVWEIYLSVYLLVFIQKKIVR